MRFTSSYFSHFAGWGVVADARHEVYEHLQRLSMRFYEDQQTGQLMSRMVNDTDRFETLVSHALPDTVINVFTLLGVGAAMAAMNWRLALLTLVPIPLVLLAVRMYTRRVMPAFRTRQRELAELNATLQDNLSGIREIKAFGREVREADRIGRRINDYRRSLLRALRLMATFSPFVEFASSLGTVIVIWFGGRLALGGRLRPRRPRGLLPLPRDVLRPGARPERRLGAGAGVAGRRRAGRRAAGRAARHRRPARAPCRFRTGSRGPWSSGTWASATPAGSPCWSTSPSTSRRAP